MKRYVKITCSVLCLLITAAAFCGCNGCLNFSTYEDDVEYLYKKINAIPVEYEGYVLTDDIKNLPTEGEYVQLKEGAEINGDYPFNGGTLNIKYNGLDGYEFLYGGLQKQLTAEYMEAYSKTFVKMEYVWDMYKDNKPCKVQLDITDIKSVTVFDDQVFVVVSRWSRYLTSGTSAYKNIPWHFYRWDLEKDELLYCGYCYTTRDTVDNVYSFYIKRTNTGR